MGSIKKGKSEKNAYEMKTPKIGRREVENSKKALQLLRLQPNGKKRP